MRFVYPVGDEVGLFQGFQLEFPQGARQFVLHSAHQGGIPSPYQVRGEDGAKHRPVMLHRAILGSFERFIGILIEHYSGKFPLWLAPLQVVVATITNDANAYACKVLSALEAAGFRAKPDLRNEKINYKVREHSHAKVPVILVVGAREAKDSTVAMRRLDGKDQEILELEEAVARLNEEATSPADRL